MDNILSYDPSAGSPHSTQCPSTMKSQKTKAQPSMCVLALPAMSSSLPSSPRVLISPSCFLIAQDYFDVLQNKKEVGRVCPCLFFLEK